ncbi:MAG: multidrug transporter [Citrobacter freundii]|nr:MAG: multidrug transporter [Citrobacter freundii]
MHSGQRYTFREMMKWTRSDIYFMLVLSSIPVLLFELAGWTWLALPWVPIAMIGTATAFIVGFRNTQTYNRTWEARQIYGAIVNTSRSWGMLVRDFIGIENTDGIKAIKRTIIQRHIAWLTALRYQLREQRSWETARTKPSNIRYGKLFSIAEWDGKLEDQLRAHLSEEEAVYILSKKNRATHLLGQQSAQIKQLKTQGLIDPLDYVEMEKLLVDLYEQQGKCERIKNFPYPRQFATISQMLTRLFVCLVPFGVLAEFHKLGDWKIWLGIPFSATVGWIFLTLERVGENTENPFEGGPNDVPITSISRTIEIDLLEMIDEKDLPGAIAATNQILT